VTALAVVLACAALAFAYAAWERAGVTARAMHDHGQAITKLHAATARDLADHGELLDEVAVRERSGHFDLLHRIKGVEALLADHGQALQDVRAELFNQKDTRASPASECTCNRPE
jgi:hypothetical protein